MEKRKIIRFGSSHVVSLPKEWVVKNNLNKDKDVYLEAEGGKLVISISEKNETNNLNKRAINVDDFNFNTVRRMIAASYIAGYRTLEFKGRNLKTISQDIRKIIQGLMVFEVVKETSTQLIAKDFMNLEEVSLEDIIKRMDNIARSMIDGCFNAINGVFVDIGQLEVDVNKLRFLVLRVVKRCLKDENFRKISGKDYSELLDCWMLALHIEKVADHIKNIDALMKNHKILRKFKDNLIRTYAEIKAQYWNAMNSYYKKDPNMAYSVADRHFPTINNCNNLFKYTESAQDAIIIEELKYVEVMARNISRLSVVDNEFLLNNNENGKV